MGMIASSRKAAIVQAFYLAQTLPRQNAVEAERLTSYSFPAMEDVHMGIRLFLLTITIVLFSSVASAQAPKLGEYQLDWARLHHPVRLEPPSLIFGSERILIEPSTPECPAEAVSMARSVPDGNGIWCFDSQGSIYMDVDVPDFGFAIVGFWSQFLDGKAIVKTDGAIRGDMLTGVTTFVGPLKVFITGPREGASVRGPVWVVMWAEGTIGSANVYTLSADGKQIGSQTTSSRGPVTIFWDTSGVAKGTHTLTGVVRDAEGSTASTTVHFILQ
jgi:hypothetical protein